MLGAVLWTDQATGRAVLWCADQGPLAFHIGGPALTPGDTVAFDVENVAGHRLATQLRLAPTAADISLPPILIAEATRQLDPASAELLFTQLEAIIGEAPMAEEVEDTDEDDLDDWDDEEEEAPDSDEPVWPSNVVPFRFTGLPRKKRD